MSLYCLLSILKVPSMPIKSLSAEQAYAVFNCSCGYFQEKVQTR